MASVVAHHSGLAARPKRRPYTDREWEERRPVITALFESGKNQNEILQSLEQQFPQFRPTLPMLKRRITRWGLSRYHNEADAAAAIRVALERETQSKKTAFIIGNKKVTREEIDRYLRRKGVKDARSFALNPDRKPPISAIVPYTPPPTPPPSSESDEANDRSQTGSADEEYLVNETLDIGAEYFIFPTEEALLMRVSGTHQIKAALAGPREMEFLQSALLGNDAYYRSIYPFHTPATTPEASLIYVDELLDSFTSGMWRGRDLLIEGEMTGAFKCFDKAFDSINTMTVQRSRRFLPELFEMFLNFQLEERFDILQSLLCFIEQICRVNVGQNGWLSQIAVPLLQLSRADRVEAVERLMLNVVGHFQANVGQDHPETKSLIKALSRSVFRRKPVAEAIGHLQKLLQDDAAAASMTLYESCNVLVELALCHRVQNRFEEAGAWAQRAWDQAETLDSAFHETDIKVRCLRVLIYIEKKRGDWQGAYALAKQAVDISVVGLGAEDSLTALVQVEMTDLQGQAQAAGVELFLFDDIPKEIVSVVRIEELPLFETDVIA